MLFGGINWINFKTHQTWPRLSQQTNKQTAVYFPNKQTNPQTEHYLLKYILN